MGSENSSLCKQMDTFKKRGQKVRESMVPHKHVCFINCLNTKALPFSGQTPLGHIFQLYENFNSSLASISCEEGEGTWIEHQITKCRNGFNGN